MYRLKRKLLAAMTVAGLVFATSITAVRAQSLTLTVNPFSGAASIQNTTLDGPLVIDGYQITSASGSLVPDPAHAVGVGWDSLANAGVAGWQEIAPTTIAISELNISLSTSVPAGGTLNLGHPFAPNGAPDLTWAYSAPGGSVTNPAEIVYAGGLQVRVINLVNSAAVTESTRVVLLNQESSQSFNFDAYTIGSASGSLNVAGFSGFAGHAVPGWLSVGPSANGVSELNLTGSTSLAPGHYQPLGEVFSAGSAEDLTLVFHLVGLSTTPFQGTVLYDSQLAGDVNGDNVVNIFDINLISSNWATTGLAGDANYDGIVNIFDINFVSSHWNNTLGGAGAGITPVPEPSSFALAALGLFIGCSHVCRRRHQGI